MTERERSIRLVRVLPASPEEVFDAWTDPKSIQEWMCPGAISEAVATLDVRINGRFTIIMKSPSCQTPRRPRITRGVGGKFSPSSKPVSGGSMSDKGRRI